MGPGLGGGGGPKNITDPGQIQGWFLLMSLCLHLFQSHSQAYSRGSLVLLQFAGWPAFHETQGSGGLLPRLCPDCSLFRPLDPPPPSNWQAVGAAAHLQSCSVFCILFYFWPLEIFLLFLNKPFWLSLVYVSLLCVWNGEVVQVVNSLCHLDGTRFGF